MRIVTICILKAMRKLGKAVISGKFYWMDYGNSITVKMLLHVPQIFTGKIMIDQILIRLKFQGILNFRDMIKFIILIQCIHGRDMNITGLHLVFRMQEKERGHSVMLPTTR